MSEIAPGRIGTAELVVDESDLAVALGSGDVPVLGTPRVVALCEAATVAAVAEVLAPGETTVGTRVEVDHRRATPLGARVVAEAELVAVDGRRLAYEVTASDPSGVVAEGRVERVRVDRDRFLSGLG